MGQEIKLYSNNCPNCIITKTKLKSKEIEFEEINDMDVIMAKASELKYSMLPFLKVGAEWFQGQEAIAKVEGM